MRRGRYVVALRRVFSERESGEHRLPVRQRTDSLRRTCHVRQLVERIWVATRPMLARMFAVSCRELQGRGPWSQRQSLQAPFLNESLRAHESFPADYFCANDIRPGAGREAPFHVRGHDETQARRRTGAVAGREVGRVRLHRCRSGSEYEDFAFVDRASDWR